MASCTCRICLSPVHTSPRFAHCGCKGSLGLHTECLEKWMRASGRLRCEICDSKFLYVSKGVLADCETVAFARALLENLENEDDDDYDARTVAEICAETTKQIVSVILTFFAVCALA